VDLDRNGVNDWKEHGKKWLKEQWLEGVHKVVTDLRNRTGKDKVIHLNSGGFHRFDWKSTNGMTFENMGMSYSFMSLKRNYDRWLPIAPHPHTILTDGKGFSKDSFYWMRFLLGMALYGDGYYSYAEEDGHHFDRYYDEFDVDLGYPTGPMQYIISKGHNGLGIWVRFFDHGAVIVNINGDKAVVEDKDIESRSGYDGPYYKFRGGQHPDFNNGKQFDQVTFRGRWNKQKTAYAGDAIILVKTPQTIVADIIIDNSDAATSPASKAAQLTGNWKPIAKNNNSWTTGARAHKKIYNCAVTPPGTGTASAIFKPTIGVAGNYEVYEWHGRLENSPQATNVPVIIEYHNGLKFTGTIDQSRNQGQWNSLGVYYFEKGIKGAITISDKANGKVIADAFKFVYEGKTKK
jgi:hypothetical protein